MSRWALPDLDRVLAGKTIDHVEGDTYTSNDGPEQAIVLVFTDGTEHAIVMPNDD